MEETLGVAEAESLMSAKSVNESDSSSSSDCCFYRTYCESREGACLSKAKHGGYWASDPTLRQFGPASVPGDLQPPGSPRWKQRAFYDFLKDVAPIAFGTPLARLAIWDTVSVNGCEVPVLFTGRLCTCGAIGCAEAEASGWALPLVVKEWPGINQSVLSKYPDVGFKELFEESAAGDSVAMAIRDRCLNIWAADAVGLVHAYDPEIIVIGGGVMKSAAIIIPYVEQYVEKHAWTPWGKVRVRAAALGNNAALLGAVPLLSER